MESDSFKYHLDATLLTLLIFRTFTNLLRSGEVCAVAGMNRGRDAVLGFLVRLSETVSSETGIFLRSPFWNVDILTLEDETVVLSRNIGDKLASDAVTHSRRTETPQSHR
jgi:hypothetical protein